MAPRILLAGPAVPPPALYYASEAGRRAPVVDGTVTVYGAKYRVLDGAVVDGEVLQVEPRGYALRVAEIEATACLAVEADERRRAEEEASRRVRVDATAANARLDLPCRWSPVIRAVASGVSARGAGNGVYARSVVHIRCDEPLSARRLRRGAGSLLCGASSGALDYVVDAVSHDGAGETYADRVTCRACLAAAARIAVMEA